MEQSRKCVKLGIASKQFSSGDSEDRVAVSQGVLNGAPKLTQKEVQR